MISVAVVSDTVLHRAGLVRLLEAHGRVDIVLDADIHSAMTETYSISSDVTLLDLSLRDACSVSVQLRSVVPDLKAIALGVPETNELVLTCAEAGIRGYVSPQASLDELVSAIELVVRNELACSPAVAAGLMERVASLTGGHQAATGDRLTPRELEILDLVALGLSNRAVGARLGIEISTVKTHIHNLLEKLDCRSRGEAASLARQRWSPLERSSDYAHAGSNGQVGQRRSARPRETGTVSS